jgi:peptidoglycan/LPS O-acetylase OafA/YrhL
LREDPAGPRDWLGYYPRRLVRLYVPTWAAIGLAAVLAHLVHRHGVAGFSNWLAWHDNPTWHGVTKDAELLKGTDGLNGPLWTLRWEMWFSLLLPFYVVLARVGRRASLIKVLIMLDLIAVGMHIGRFWLVYLPIFGIGSAIAGDLDRVWTLAAWLRGRWVTSVGLLLVALALLDYRSLRLLDGPLSPTDAAIPIATAAGAGLLVLLVLTSGAPRWLCSSPPAQWLGKVSFSLYLVHEPIVVSVALLLGKGTSIYVVAAIAIPLCLLAAWLFQLVVEGPAHDLSQRIGRAISGRPVRREARAEQFT